MKDCVFCKIVNSELPSYKLYEDNEFIVILDRFPSCAGHTLIIPKQHIENIYELDNETAGKIFQLTTKIAKALKTALNVDGMNVLQFNGAVAGQSVMHFHIHLVPRADRDGIIIKWKNTDPLDEKFQEILDCVTKEISNIKTGE